MFTTHDTAFGGQILAANHVEMVAEWDGAWEQPDAVADIAFVAGLLGLLSGLLIVVRMSGTHFPDTLFWRALPPLLVLPPALFLGALYAPGGMLDSSAGRARAVWLGFSGLASYVAPVIILSLAAALASRAF
jgi:hypothetical protein